MNDIAEDCIGDNQGELLNDGLKLFADHKYEHSIGPLSCFLAHDPVNRTARLSRGAAYLKLDLLKEAVADFTDVNENDDSYARAYHLRGLAHERQDDDEAALKDFDRAIACDPEYGAAYYSRANLWFKTGWQEQGMADMQMVTRLGQQNLESFAAENNVWQTQHMRVEDAMETELNR